MDMQNVGPKHERTCGQTAGVSDKGSQDCGSSAERSRMASQEGGYGEGGGRRVQDGEHMYTCISFLCVGFKLCSFKISLYNSLVSIAHPSSDL